MAADVSPKSVDASGVPAQRRSARRSRQGAPSTTSAHEVREAATEDNGAAAGLDILSKAAAVITVLERDGELTVNDIAARVGEPVSSTYRLITNLAALGWVERSMRRGEYRLGVYFMRVGGVVEDHIDLRAVCRPSLELLRTETGASSFLCLRRGGRAVCIERFEGRAVRSLAMRMGDSLPLYAGAAPMAILAFLPKADREAYVGALGSIHGELIPVPSQQELLKTIDRTRRNGFSVSDGDVTPGIAAVGAPIYNHRGELEGSISVSGLTHTILGDDAGDIPAHLCAAATEVSRRLGGDGRQDR